MFDTFKGTVRSERHFSALLLPHLLMSNNFAGCRALFKKLEICDGEPFDLERVEIVAELNPVRDVVKRSDEMGLEPLGKQSQVVPDLFLRIGNSALVIEAKFFTYPPVSAVEKQMARQREAIRRSVWRNTEYGDCRFCYLALTVDELTKFTYKDQDTFQMTWSDIIEVLKDVFRAEDAQDTGYALRELENAVERSRVEQTSSNENGRCKSIGELLQKAVELLEKGNQYVGYTDGLPALAKATVEDLENRGHYKYSSRKPNKNWIPLRSVISRYLELKAPSARD